MYPASLYLKDKWISFPLIIVLLVEAFISWYTITKIHPSGDQFLLHYNIIFGIDLIGEWWKVWLIPLGGLLLPVLNFGIAHLFYDQNRFIARFIVILTSLFEFLLLAGCILIIGLNA